jgi:dTDP-4-amino-4,6-dideoxygalactose transaminase
MKDNRIPLVDLSAQYLSIKSEVDAAIAEVISESAFVGTASNRFVLGFERDFATFVGLRHCVACANGTDSLEILLKAAGIGPGDEVLVPALSWIATSEAVTTCGATPVFVDIIPGQYCLNPDDAAAKVTARTKAIIPVHLYGLPAPMDDICRIAERHGLFVLEDCAQGHGAMFQGRHVGNFGHAASFSFFPGKNLGAWGDAGAMLTNDERLARTARMIAQHGQSEKKHDHHMEGRNSRMDGLQAAILSAKLPHLPEWIAARRRAADRYRSELDDVVEGLQSCPPGSESAYHLFVVEIENRNEIQAALDLRGVSTAVQYPCPLPLLRAYERMRYSPEDFPESSRTAARILSLPLYPELTGQQQSDVIEALRGALRQSNAAVATT